MELAPFWAVRTKLCSAPSHSMVQQLTGRAIGQSIVPSSAALTICTRTFVRRVLKHCTASGLAALEQDLTASGGAQPGTSAGAASTSGKGASAPASTTTPGGTVGGGLGWSRDRVLQRFPLLYPALEGLARYTHLVSVEYFNDLMEVFKQVGRGVGRCGAVYGEVRAAGSPPPLHTRCCCGPSMLPFVEQLLPLIQTLLSHNCLPTPLRAAASVPKVATGCLIVSLLITCA